MSSGRDEANVLAYRGDLASLRAHLSADPGSLDRANGDRMTPLLSACRGLIDDRSVHGPNADHASVIISFLLREKGAKTDVANRRGYGPMTLAAGARDAAKRVSVLGALVDHGADPLDAVMPSTGGASPSSSSSSCSSSAAVKTARTQFLAFGGTTEAWVDIESRWFRVMCTRPSMITPVKLGRLLMANGACLERDLDATAVGVMEAWSESHAVPFTRMIARFASETSGKTPLMVAAAQGLSASVRFLHGTGLVDINAQSANSKVTALHMALSYLRLDTAKVLVECGCDTTVRNGAGLTAVESARREGRIRGADLDSFEAHLRATQAAKMLASAITGRDSALGDAVGKLATARSDVSADQRQAAVAAVTRAMYDDPTVAEVAFASTDDDDDDENSVARIVGTHGLDPSLVQALSCALRGSYVEASRALTGVDLTREDSPDAALGKVIKDAIAAVVKKDAARAVSAWRAWDRVGADTAAVVGAAVASALKLWLASIVLRAVDTQGAGAVATQMTEHEWLRMWQNSAVSAVTLALCAARGTLGPALDRDEYLDNSNNADDGPRNVIVVALAPVATRAWDAHSKGAIPVIHPSSSLASASASASATPVSATASQDALIRGQWSDIKQHTGLTSTAIDELMTLTELRSVKEKMLAIARAIDVRRRQGIDLADENVRHHVIFKGNPGTGKTTVARLYARFLVEVGEIPPGAGFYEHTGTDLITLRLEGVKTYINDIVENKGGGVLFVDEAYQLQRDTMHGHKIVDHLVAEMENHKDKLVVIFAGYKKDIEKLLELNVGLHSRFGDNHFLFEDYTDEALLSILQGLVAKINAKASAGNFRFQDDKHPRIAIKRIGSGRGTEGFGNARAVETFVHSMIRRQRDRIARERGSREDIFLLKRDDVLGPRPDNRVIERSKAYRAIMSMHGLDEVKARIHSVIEIVRENAEREEREEDPLPMTPNAVFVGNPGTGKTTVARLYGELLRDLGVLSKGEYHEKKRVDLVGQVVGETAQKTKAAIEAARGSVLVIDEAYALLQSSRDGPGSSSGGADIYGQEAIDTIVGEVHNNAGDDIAVILVGYAEETRRMINSANPGLKRRFPCDDQSVFFFKDYDDDALLHILTDKLARKGLESDLDDMLEAIKVLSKQRDAPNFGNAGAVNTLCTEAIQRQRRRVGPLLSSEASSTPITADERATLNCTLVAEDFNPKLAAGRKHVNVDTLFDDLIGCHEIRTVVRKFTSKIEDARVMGHAPSVDFTFLFTGNPGTGKTTAARRMGELFFELGILATSEVCEIAPELFQTGYTGQAPAQTRKIFDESLGKVLFIDEAYKLNPKNGGPFMKEVLDTIVSILTEDRYRGKVVVVLAGYDRDINELLTVNLGLSRRFKQTVHFHDLKPREALEILGIKLKGNGGRRLADDDGGEAADAALDRFTRLIGLPGWGNGGDVETIAEEIVAAISDRCSGDPDKQKRAIATARDVIAAMDPIVEVRERRAESQRASAVASAEMHAFFDIDNGNAINNPNGAFNHSPHPRVAQQQQQQQQQQAGQLDTAMASAFATSVRIEEEQQLEETQDQDIIEEQEQDFVVVAQFGTDVGVDPQIAEETERLIREQERKEAEEKAEAERIQREIEAFEEAMRAEAEELRRLEIERQIREARERERKIREEQEREMRAQQKLRTMGVCPAGYRWAKQNGGYRCSAGGHFVSDGQLGL